MFANHKKIIFESGLKLPSYPTSCFVDFSDLITLLWDI